VQKKTTLNSTAEPDVKTCSTEALLQAYEGLRGVVMGGRRRPLRGLGILIHEGMAAWMRVVAATASAAAVPTSAPSALVPLAAGVEHEVVDVLATMALCTTREAKI
jgi:hypothetical protein